jgi:outer membrane biosynthesis protein TonB
LKHLSSGVFTAALAVGFGLSVLAAPTATLATQSNVSLVTHAAPLFVAQAPPPDFGSPPSGEYPILFNDHHVYAKPDVDKQNRVLAALVRGHTILVPLRSMFEQMGATVSYDPASKTVDVSKPGSDIKVTVGKPEVIINGESRPLDVPPIVYHGTILVPVRVISEGMGAYVQWVPEKRTVVVRYVPAPPPTPPPPPPPPPTPSPSPVPTAPPPTPAPTPTPAPSKAPYYDHFIVGDYMVSPKVYNEFSPGNSGNASYTARGAVEFPLAGLTFMVGADWRHWNYPHNAPTLLGVPCPNVGCVTVIGGSGQAFVLPFTAQENDVDGRLGIKVFDPRFYIAGSYIWENNLYGYPTLRGWGFGGEKLPDLDTTIAPYGSVYYYPSVWGTYAPNGLPLQYRLLRYEIGVDWNFGGPTFPVFLDVGFLGNYATNKVNAPSNINKYAPYVGLGIHF